MNSKKILHLTDLHFGYEEPTAAAQRINTLNALIDCLCGIEDEWKPDLVVISGDIAWAGSSKDYEAATTWLQSLLQTVEITNDKLIVCAGNHDIDRTKTKGFARPHDPREANDFLKIEHLKNLTIPFESFQQFCKTLGINKLKAGDNQYQLFGVTEIANLKFLVVNSSWFCRDDKDEGKLYLGRPQFEVMNSFRQLTDHSTGKQCPITLTIIHHPPERWCHDSECNARDGNQSTYDYIVKRSHIIFTGHEHTQIADPDIKSNQAVVFKGGASYEGSNYTNNFSIYRIDLDANVIVRKPFEFRTDTQRWMALDQRNPVKLLNVNNLSDRTHPDQGIDKDRIKTQDEMIFLLDLAKEKTVSRIKYWRQSAEDLVKKREIANHDELAILEKMFKVIFDLEESKDSLDRNQFTSEQTTLLKNQFDESDKLQQSLSNKTR